MLALSLDMAATASSWVANSTSASPVTLPSGPTSMCTRTGFRGEKNYAHTHTHTVTSMFGRSQIDITLTEASIVCR